jgi:hypothetical protein
LKSLMYPSSNSLDTVLDYDTWISPLAPVSPISVVSNSASISKNSRE